MVELFITDPKTYSSFSVEQWIVFYIRYIYWFQIIEIVNVIKIQLKIVWISPLPNHNRTLQLSALLSTDSKPTAKALIIPSLIQQGIPPMGSLLGTHLVYRNKYIYTLQWSVVRHSVSHLLTQTTLTDV